MKLLPAVLMKNTAGIGQAIGVLRYMYLSN